MMMNEQPAAAAANNVNHNATNNLYRHPHLQSTTHASMHVSDQERQWALDLKQAVNASERINLQNPISDMELTQHAIIAKGNVIEALVRIEGLERFRREYQIDHTLEQGTYLLQAFMNQQPGYLLHIDANPETHEGIVVVDSAAFYETAAFEARDNISVDETWRICVAGQYYFHYALAHSLAGMRQGVTSLVECEGVGWHNFRSEYVSRYFEEMMGYMPVRHNQIRAYNTTVVANLLFSLARPFMPTSMKRGVQLGLQINNENSGHDSTTMAPRRLSEFYLQPTMEVAQQRVIQRFQAFLAIRKYHEENFRL